MKDLAEIPPRPRTRRGFFRPHDTLTSCEVEPYIAPPAPRLRPIALPAVAPLPDWQQDASSDEGGYGYAQTCLSSPEGGVVPSLEPGLQVGLPSPGGRGGHT
ncbi:hypothetical protein BKA93DRAFT_821785 [Sparassis latifolia]|uniref:Uncharacterized protein n=1 Tax=Sparassis crispa TaxID=139825 RepID=A0A401GMU0_9APHY|nr:hypothetical protein SCP_0505390 [Sparassis crispa]GBE83489.1 hypothetical protein SCP_0505390 [Sparassis crispa]